MYGLGGGAWLLFALGGTLQQLHFLLLWLTSLFSHHRGPSVLLLPQGLCFNRSSLAVSKPSWEYEISSRPARSPSAANCASYLQRLNCSLPSRPSSPPFQFFLLSQRNWPQLSPEPAQISPFKIQSSGVFQKTLSILQTFSTTWISWVFVVQCCFEIAWFGAGLSRWLLPRCNGLLTCCPNT